MGYQQRRANHRGDRGINPGQWNVTKGDMADQLLDTILGSVIALVW
jgi:hypothetical protein